MESRNSAYWKFGAMIVTSMIVMFVIMYLNTYALDHVMFSETRFYMTFVMGAAMAVVMLSFMLGMYKEPRINIAIFAGSALVFAVALWLVRSQETVRREIAEMKWLLDDIAAHGEAETEADAAARPVPEFEASASPDPA